MNGPLYSLNKDAKMTVEPGKKNNVRLLTVYVTYIYFIGSSSCRVLFWNPMTHWRVVSSHLIQISYNMNLHLQVTVPPIVTPTIELIIAVGII